jgi:2-phosphosulfolactate phosphatase
VRIAVVIDVLRAFSTACVAFERGAKGIVLAQDANAAFRVKREHRDYLLVGETDGYPIEGFDFGNSPTELSFADVEGRVLVHKTTAGVPATLGVLDRDRVFVTGLMTAKITSAHAENLGLVQYIPSDRFGDEDIACAGYMRGEITLERARERVVASDAAQKFLRNEESAFPRSDLDICLRQATERFVMEVRLSQTPIVEKVSL